MESFSVPECKLNFQLNKEVLISLLTELPHFEFGFAYGSGVLQQKEWKPSIEHDGKPMIDFILCVDNSCEWHKENIKINPTHYSSVCRWMGGNNVSYLQEGFSAKLFYNTLIPIERGPLQGRLMKYGVISKNDLLEDLLTWTWLYAAGRMHKPIVVFKESTDKALIHAIDRNLESAVRASLLLLPPTFTTRELYLTITSLSYSGDFRMKVAESPSKVKSIVDNNIHFFNQMYRKALKAIYQIEGKSADSSVFYQSQKVDDRISLIEKLPSALRFNKLEYELKDSVYGRKEKDTTLKIISSLVSASSRKQALKGIVTAGLKKSFFYATSKIVKKYK